MASIMATAIPKSDQLNADDLIAGEITVKVDRIESFDTPDQPLHIHLEGYAGRPYKPSKGMRRVLAFAYDDNDENLAGKYLTLYRCDKVSFGGNMGGIKIRRLSGHEDFTIMLTEKRGRRAAHSVIEIPQYPDELFTTQIPKMQAAIESGKSTVDQIISFCLRTGYLTDEQKQRLITKP